jgi:hypothetical protein
MKRDTSYADKRIAEELAKPVPKEQQDVWKKYPMDPPRSDVAISLTPSVIPNLPVSAARQEMNEARLKPIRNMGESEVRGVASVVMISPQFLMRLALQGPFRKVERHFADLASDSFNMVSKAMVKGWRKQMKKQLKKNNK